MSAPTYPRCQARHDAFAFGPGPGGPTTIGGFSLQCERERDHDGAHHAHLPEAAGADAGKLFPWPGPASETEGERTCRELEETNADVRTIRTLLVDYQARAFTKRATTRLNALLFLDLVLAQQRHELETIIRNLTKTEIP